MNQPLLQQRVRQAFDLLRDKRFTEAREILEQLVKDELGDAVVFETLGDVREKLGDEAGAAEAWHIAVDLFLLKANKKRAQGVLEMLLILRPDDEVAADKLRELNLAS
jgi:Flp pilus assembly protein TadD